MKTLVCLASYPKSGNTWMLIFLAAYQKRPGDALLLNEAFRTTISDSKRQEFEKLAGRGELTDQEVDELREAMQKDLAARVKPPVLVKTHNARVRHNGFPMIRRELSLGGAIYIVRNPLDIVDSVADHWGCSIDHAIHMEPKFPQPCLRGEIDRRIPNWSPSQLQSDFRRESWRNISFWRRFERPSPGMGICFGI